MKHTFKFSMILMVLVVVLSVCLMTSCNEKTNEPVSGALVADNISTERGDAQASGTCPDGLTWTIYSNGELVLSGTPEDGAMYDYAEAGLVPGWAEHASDIYALTLDDNIKVISPEAFSAMKKIVWIQFGNGVETIGANAFRSCVNLRRIILPASVKSIGANAFDGCYRMYEAHLNDGLTQIGDKAFAGCRSLVTVAFPEANIEVGKDVFTDSAKLTEIITTNPRVERGSDLYGNLAKYVPNANCIHGKDGEVRVVKQDDFLIYNGNRLIGYTGAASEVTVPDAILQIAPSAFYANTALESVVIGNKTTHINAGAFEDCSSIETLTLGAGIKNIEASAFAGCVNIKTINYNAKSCTSAPAAFAGLKKLTTIKFGTGVSELPEDAGLFRNCTSLESVTLPAVEVIPESMFEGCTALKSVTFNDTIEDISDRAFANCASLTGVDFTTLASKSKIRDNAFNGCSSLVMIDLKQVGTLENGAFGGCTGLVSVVTGTALTTTGEVFDGCEKLIDVVYNVSGSTPKPGSADKGGLFKNTIYTAGKGAKRIEEVNGFLFFKGPKIPAVTTGANPTPEVPATNYLVGYIGEGGNLTLPAFTGGYTIYKKALIGNTTITGLTFGADVKEIRENAFRNCTSLTSVNFEGATSLTSIGAYAFDGCRSLATLKLSANLSEIGAAAFRNCERLGEINLLSVSKLGQYAFQYSGMTKLTAGTALVNVPEDAFSGCAQLTTVTLPGAVNIGNQAFANCKALTRVEIPAAETIGEYAFYANTKLGELALPAGKSIAQGAFERCQGLYTLTLGANMESIADYAFNECKKLVHVVNLSTNPNFVLQTGELGPGYVTMAAVWVDTTAQTRVQKTADNFIYIINGDKAYLLGYVGEDVEKLTLPTTLGGKSAYEIFNAAFYGATAKEVVVSEGVTLIGVAAFMNSSVEKVSLPATLRTVQDSAFEGSALREITIAAGLKTVGAAVFKNCRELKAVIFPNTVTSVGLAAFRECVSLRKVDLGAIKKVPSYLFDGCISLPYIKIPATVKNISTEENVSERWFAGCKSLLEIEFSGGGVSTLESIMGRTEKVQVTKGNPSKIYKDTEGFIFWTSGTTSYLVGYEGTKTDITLPKKCKNNPTYEIFDYAFYNRDDLTSIRITDSVTAVGKYAFAECDNLKGIYLPTSFMPGNDRKGVGENLCFGCSGSFVLATGYADESLVPANWNKNFNVQGDIGIYEVVYGVTYDIFLGMLK